MGSKIIEHHKFDEAKNQLRRFVDNIPSNVQYVRFKEDGAFWGLLTHKVTGEEMNKYADKLQDLFIQINKNFNRVVNLFRNIYNTIDTLDSEYITGILTSVEAAKEASDQALSASLRAEVTQKEVDKIVKTLQIGVTKLEQFKKQVESANEEKNKEFQTLQLGVEKLEQFKKEAGSAIEEIRKEFKVLQLGVERLEQFKKQVESANEEKNKEFQTLQLGVEKLEQFKKEKTIEMRELWTNAKQQQRHIETMQEESIQIKTNLEAKFSKKHKISFWISTIAITLSVVNVALIVYIIYGFLL